MIYLTTGGNGAGKTLFTLYDVRKQQLKENRPVYYHGFTAGEQLREWGWQEFNPREWQDLPDGSICIFDECQNEFPAKVQDELPDYINAVAQHRRRRGFDFWMITPHPSLIHVNVRRLVESPSWHRHLKRTFGGDMVSELKFNHAETSCEKPGAGDKGQVTMRAFPKEVYGWYQSASLHTGKRKLPKQVWVLGGAVAAACILGFFGYKKFLSGFEVDDKSAATSIQAMHTEARQTPPQEAPKRPLTLAEYLDQGTPRIPGMAHTAPRYDALTRPVRVPRPKSCIKFADNPCECTSQQGTRLVMSEETCMGIIKNGGVFTDWDTNPSRARGSGYQLTDYYQTGNRPDTTRTSVYDVIDDEEAEHAKPKPRATANQQMYSNSARPESEPRMVEKLEHFGKGLRPGYPRNSARNREQGRVVLRVSISPLGEVSTVTVQSSSGYAALDEAAIKAVRATRFKPYMKNGIAYPAQADIPFDFVLKG